MKKIIAMLVVLATLVSLITVLPVSAEGGETRLAGTDVVLMDGVLLNFYIEADESLGVDSAETATVNGKEYYVVTVELAAKEMDKVVSAQLYNGSNPVGEAYSSSVAEYAAGILAGNYSQVTKDLVEAMLAYGAAAKDYFAGEFNPDADVSALLGAEAAEVVIADEAEIFLGASLVLEGKMKLRFYFKGNVDVTVDGEAANVVKKSNYCYAEVPVTPANIDKVFEAKAGDTTVKYSPLNYLKNNAANGELAQIVASIYAYGVAADEYVRVELCEHENADLTVVKLPTVLTEGVKAGHCDDCGRDVTVAVEREDYDVLMFDDDSERDLKVGINIAERVLVDGKHFYPTKDDPDGNDLFVEFSFLWNETLANSTAGWIELARIQSSKVSDYDSAFWFALKNGCSETWCPTAGGFEIGTGDYISYGPAHGSTKTYTENGDFALIGDYGWHRIGVQIHQEAYVVDGEVVYRFENTLYIDGVKVHVIEYNSMKNDNALFTATYEDGVLEYKDIADTKYIYAFRAAHTGVDGDAYLAYSDLYITCGDNFVVNVDPVAEPEAETAELGDTTVPASSYYKVAGVACEHFEALRWTESSVATMHANGTKVAHCSSCGVDFTEETFSSIDLNYVSKKPNAVNTFYETVNLGKVMGANSFYPTADDADGNDLLIEFSMFFDADVLNNLNGTNLMLAAFSNSADFYTTKDKIVKDPIYFYIKENSKWCPFPGGFELYGKEYEVGGYPNPVTTNRDDYVIVEGFDGWHRLGVRYHQEDYADGSSDIIMTIYVDGDVVCKASMGWGDFFYSVDGTGYTHNEDLAGLFVAAYRFGNANLSSGSEAYLPISDMFVTVGDDFVLDVIPVANPADQTFTQDGVSLSGKAYYKLACDCEHENVVLELVTPATIASDGLKKGICPDCGVVVSEVVKAEPNSQIFTDESPRESYHEAYKISDVLGGDHFYPTEENPSGQDLYVEFSFLWNPSLLNNDNSNGENYIYMGLLGDAEGNDSRKTSFHLACRDNAPDFWCTWTGGFEPSANKKVHFGPSLKPGSDENFVFIGDYGWHRLGFQLHQFTTASDSTVKHSIIATLYLDGVKVSSYTLVDGVDNKNANLLYSATASNGKITGYGDGNLDRYILPYKLAQMKSKDGTEIYFATADVSVSAGNDFRMQVVPNENPAKADYVAADGKVLDGTVHYQLTESKFDDQFVGEYIPVADGALLAEGESIEDVLDGRHFYPHEENNLAGRDLYVEFSLLWNPTLANYVEDNCYAWIGALANSDPKAARLPTFMLLYRDDVSSMWCQFEGGFETDNSDTIPDKYPQTPKKSPNKEDYAFIGEYGWHRIGIKYHQDVAVKNNAPVYTLTATLYVDGVDVLEYKAVHEGNQSEAAKKAALLYTVDVSNGQITNYHDNIDDRYVYYFATPTRNATGSDGAYMVIGDMYATCGDGFVVEVDPVKNPEEESALIKGLEFDTTTYYEVVED